LSLPVDSFSVNEADMEEALRLLRRKDYSRILIGFEKVSGKPNTKEDNSITLELKDTHIADVLNALCQADPRYTYQVIQGVLINVFPKGSMEDSHNLLNRPVGRFSVHGDYPAQGVIKGIGDLVPELRAHLREKREEYFAKKGIVPGSPGAIGTGNMPSEFHLKFEGGTVRDVLNAVVLHSLRRYQDATPDPTGWRTPPTSWKYEFTIDPDAPTGLGGIPSWDTLD
jgi:hypothetical protein